MPNYAFSMLRLTALAATILLAACGRGDEGNLASLDSQLAANNADPALTSALEDQILVDPSLAQQSNSTAVRPPETPTQAQYPKNPEGGAPGEARARFASVSSETGAPCQNAADYDYNLAWAKRLSPAFAVFPGGRLTDAAANNRGGCRVRVVTFTTREAPGRVLGWYHQAARRAGYSAEQQSRDGDIILGGVNQADGGAFYLIVTPVRAGGAEVALFANNGR